MMMMIHLMHYKLAVPQGRQQTLILLLKPLILLLKTLYFQRLGPRMTGMKQAAGGQAALTAADGFRFGRMTQSPRTPLDIRQQPRAAWWRQGVSTFAIHSRLLLLWVLPLGLQTPLDIRQQPRAAWWRQGVSTFAIHSRLLLLWVLPLGLQRCVVLWLSIRNAVSQDRKF
eukprot:Selendium_serpulae@DN5637_c0_g1_i17.p1